jgi:AraC-like DNA-binding protein
MASSDIVSEKLDDEQYVRAPAQFHWAAISLAPDDLAAAARALIGLELHAPSVSRVIRPPEHRMARLQHLHIAACNLAGTAPDILEHPKVAKAMEQELIRAMIACLHEGAPVTSARETGPFMRRFHEALEAHEGEPIFLTDLCAEIGVSDRTLRLHCQEHLGMSPHRYLLLRRMNLARGALARAEGGRTTVTEVAAEYGFGELGRFAVQYRRMFGESPSVTLRRSPGSPLAMRGEILERHQSPTSNWQRGAASVYPLS